MNLFFLKLFFFKNGVPFSLQKGGDVNKLFEMGSEPERRYFLNRLLSFLEERSAPLNNMPSISKQPLDLYRLYLHVQERGGMLEVCCTHLSEFYYPIVSTLWMS